MKQGLSTDEQITAAQLKADGWQLLRHGWPDWACIKTDADGKIIAVKFVEAKLGNQEPNARQRAIFEIFKHLGFPVELARRIEEDNEKNDAAVNLGRKGGQATAKNLSKEQRQESARRAALARWRKAGKGNARLHDLADAVIKKHRQPAPDPPAAETGAELMQSMQQILQEQDKDSGEDKDPWN